MTTALISQATEAGTLEPAATGTVVFLPAEEGSYHVRKTAERLTARIADLLGLPLAKVSEQPGAAGGSVFYVPQQTLVGEDLASRLGIFSEQHLYGGVVSAPFMATKVIGHALVDADAAAPPHWCADFADAVLPTVLRGFSVFSRGDAERAAEQLLAIGPCRFKPALAEGGSHQVEIADLAELGPTLETLDDAVLRAHGAVLEENLKDPVTYSVGRTAIGPMEIAYCGLQFTISRPDGRSAYGGSTLQVVKGRFEQLLATDLDPLRREAVLLAQAYDAAATAYLPRLIASRRNYDVIYGVDAEGRHRWGVLEQSWRLGGASGAEIAALEAFQREPTLLAVRATCREVYGEDPALPPQAEINFQGLDPAVGPMTKFATIDDRRYET
jgi:hypothetical protein